MRLHRLWEVILVAVNVKIECVCLILQKVGSTRGKITYFQMQRSQISTFVLCSLNGY